MKILCNIGNKIIKLSHTRWIQAMFYICLLMLAAIGYLITIKGITSLTVLYMFIFILFFFTLIIGNAYKNLTSVRGFLGNGLLNYLIIVISAGVFIHTGKFIMDITIYYIISAIIWWFYSLIANNKVASTANEILSAIFGILILIKDTYITMTPTSTLELKDGLGYTYEKSIEMISGIIFSPLLAINIIALLLCVLKGYWIEKYNNNQDVGYEYTDSHEEEN